MKRLLLALFLLAFPALAWGQIVPGTPLTAAALNAAFAGKGTAAATDLSNVLAGRMAMPQVDGNYFQITRKTNPVSFAGGRQAFVLQQEDDEDATYGQLNLNGAIMSFASTGNGNVSGGNTSHTNWGGLLVQMAKQGDGSGQTVTAESALGPVGPGGYNELGGFQGELINYGSTNGYMSGYELVTADGTSSTNYDTGMNNVVSRMQRFNNGVRLAHNFFATSEGTVPPDAIMATNGATWKNGIDFTAATILNYPFASNLFSVNGGGGIAGSSLGLQNSAGGSLIGLNTVSSGQSALMNLSSVGVLKWQLGKDGQNNLTVGNAVLGNTALSISPTSDSITVPGTGSFFSQNNAAIHRLNDRVFIGGMTANDGAYPFTNKDWLSALMVGWNPSVTFTYPDLAQGGILSSYGTGWVAGAQTLGNSTPGAFALGTASFAVCDNSTVHNQSCEGYYGEAHRTLATDGGAVGMELDTVAHVPGQPVSPATQGLTVGFQDACGGGYTSTLYACDAAMQIVANGAVWNAGIIFENGALASGVPAIEIPSTNTIKFYDTSGDQAVIQANYSTAAAGRLSFTDAGILMAGHDGSPVAYFNPITGGSDWFAFQAAAAGASLAIAAAGSDTNIPIKLTPKGAGQVVVGGGGVTAPAYTVGSTVGLSCSGSPTASFAVTYGIVTHC